MQNILLEMKKITKEFPGVKALDQVDLKVVEGEIHALCGENGAGKSTLMNVLSGVYPYGTYSGDIIFEGKVCAFKTIKDSEKAGIAIIHQELALVPYTSIAENIFLGNEQAKNLVISWPETERKAKELMEKVGLNDHPLTLVKDLGVGKQQLVEIAKALSKNVKLLILDEPTAALNDSDSQHLLHLLDNLRKEGITCIIISHKLNEIEQIADEITVIRDGKTIETLVKGVDDISEDHIIKGMVGRTMDDRFPPHVPNIGEVTFEVKNWNVFDPNDDTRQIIKDASLNIRKGEVVGLAGLMGSGRTEFVMSVFGKSYGKRISGEVIKDGKPISLNSSKDAIENGIAYLTEDRKQYGLVLEDDIKHNISLASLKKVSKNIVINDLKEAAVAQEYREKINIKTPSIDQKVGNLSGGNQQKVMLSRWIFAEPNVLILDEPTRGIDVGAKYEIYSIINQLVDSGKAVLMISSEMAELLGMCDRIFVMNEGRIVGELDRKEASQENIMRVIMQSNRNNDIKKMEA